MKALIQKLQKTKPKFINKNDVWLMFVDILKIVEKICVNHFLVENEIKYIDSEITIFLTAIEDITAIGEYVDIHTYLMDILENNFKASINMQCYECAGNFKNLLEHMSVRVLIK